MAGKANHRRSTVAPNPTPTSKAPAAWASSVRSISHSSLSSVSRRAMASGPISFSSATRASVLRRICSLIQSLVWRATRSTVVGNMALLPCDLVSRINRPGNATICPSNSSPKVTGSRRRIEHNLDATILLSPKDFVAVGRLAQGQPVRHDKARVDLPVLH